VVGRDVARRVGVIVAARRDQTIVAARRDELIAAARWDRTIVGRGDARSSRGDRPLGAAGELRGKGVVGPVAAVRTGDRRDRSMIVWRRGRA
jgi:hypothetical protein